MKKETEGENKSILLLRSFASQNFIYFLAPKSFLIKAVRIVWEVKSC
jgi:hypothetical protein